MPFVLGDYAGHNIGTCEKGKKGARLGEINYLLGHDLI